MEWDPERYARNAAFVPALGAAAVEWLRPRPGERILDLGCGDGALTVRLRDAGCDVVGVDASAAQVAAARSRGLTAHRRDGEALKFDAEFDAVFSNAALHWMKNPGAVLDGVARALKPGGRFAGEFGGKGNAAQVVAALNKALAARGLNGDDYNPWFFPAEKEYAALLVKHGFTVERTALAPRPTPLPGDLAQWLNTFATPFLAALPAAQRDNFTAEVQHALTPHLRDAAGVWHVDYMRLRFTARRGFGK